MTRPLAVLLIEDDDGDASLAIAQLRKIQWATIVVESVSTLAAAKVALVCNDYDVVVTDLGLPDSQGLND